MLRNGKTTAQAWAACLSGMRRIRVLQNPGYINLLHVRLPHTAGPAITIDVRTGLNIALPRFLNLHLAYIKYLGHFVSNHLSKAFQSFRFPLRATRSIEGAGSLVTSTFVYENSHDNITILLKHTASGEITPVQGQRGFMPVFHPVFAARKDIPVENRMNNNGNMSVGNMSVGNMSVGNIYHDKSNIYNKFIHKNGINNYRERFIERKRPIYSYHIRNYHPVAAAPRHAYLPPAAGMDSFSSESACHSENVNMRNVYHKTIFNYRYGQRSGQRRLYLGAGRAYTFYLPSVVGGNRGSLLNSRMVEHVLTYKKAAPLTALNLSFTQSLPHGTFENPPPRHSYPSASVGEGNVYTTHSRRPPVQVQEKILPAAMEMVAKRNPKNPEPADLSEIERNVVQKVNKQVEQTVRLQFDRRLAHDSRDTRQLTDNIYSRLLNRIVLEKERAL